MKVEGIYRGEWGLGVKCLWIVGECFYKSIDPLENFFSRGSKKITVFFYSAATCPNPLACLQRFRLLLH